MKIRILIALFTVFLAAAPLQTLAATIEFGDDKSEYANDGECDDRRFIGPAMANDLDEDDNYHDATDCRRAFKRKLIELWNLAKAAAATQCKKIDFGDNSGEYANDTECDDPRFEGPGMSSVIKTRDMKSDATDCRRMCAKKKIFLRNY